MTGELAGRVLHCEEPVRVISHRFGWSGEDEHERVKMACRVCAAEMELTIKTPVGPPSATGAVGQFGAVQTLSRQLAEAVTAKPEDTDQ